MRRYILDPQAARDLAQIWIAYRPETEPLDVVTILFASRNLAGILGERL